MHEYGVALKNILTRPGSSILAQLTGASSLKWINMESPKVGNRRVDLLGELPDRNLVHIELQSRNEKDFAMRMAEYLFDIGRQYGRLPRQVALYVGEAPLRMKDRVESPGVSVRFHLVDIAIWMANNCWPAPIDDNVLAVLTRLSEQPKVVRRILKRIAAGSPHERDKALPELLILARLRRLSGEVKREADKMPITEDIMDHDATVAQRIAALKPAQLKRVGLRILDAQRIEDLFAG
jgi:hypothetical protein